MPSAISARDRVRVVVRGVTVFTAGGLAALPDVAYVKLEARSGDEATFGVQARTGKAEAVQRAVTRYAIEAGFTLVANAPVRTDLEEVLVRLTD